jgi:hypothetical protein
MPFISTVSETLFFYMSVNFWYRGILTENLYENGKYPCSQITFALEFETLKSPMPSASPRIGWIPRISTRTIRLLTRGAKSSHTCTKSPGRLIQSGQPTGGFDI